MTGSSSDADEAMRLADLDPVLALSPAADAVRKARRERDAAAEAVAERAWGHALLHCGEMDDAIRHLRRSVVCSGRAASPGLAAEARAKLAFALLQRGRTAAALREVDAALPELTGARAARARAQRAIVLHLRGRLDEALAEFRAALPVLRRAGDLLGVQRMLINRAFLHADRHSFAAAEADLVEAEGLAKQLGRELTVGIVAENLGLLETLRGDVPAALGQFDRAERIIAEHGAQLAWVHRHHAELLLSVGLVTEAREFAERAVAACLAERRMLGVPEARLLLAQAAILDRDAEAAAEQARRAGREFARQGRVEWAELAYSIVVRTQVEAGLVPRVPSARIDTMVRTLAAAGWPAPALEARIVAGRLALRRGRRAEGEEHLLRASALRRRGPAALRARGWYAEALLRQAKGDAAGTVNAARAGLRVLDEHSAALGVADLRAHSAAHRLELSELGLRTALGTGRPANVLEWAEHGRARRLEYRPLRPPGDPVLAGLLAQLRATARDIEEVKVAGPGTARLLHRQAGLERRIRDHTRRFRADSPGGGPIPARVLSQALGDCALLECVQLDGVLHALTLVDGRFRTRVLGPVADAAALIDRLPFALHRLADRNVSPASAAAAGKLLADTAERLDAWLLAPSPELRDRPLVVVPTGPLHSLPWSVLPSCAGRPVAVSPSAALWYSAWSRCAEIGRVAVAAGPGLAGAREEAKAIAAIHGTASLLDGSATVDAVLGALASADLVHLAAHGRLATEHPLFSSLLLHDGPLVVHDLDRLARVPRTVVLAACDSGRSVVCSGDELLGLGAAFIARGTARLVASVVPIPDAETAPMMVELHRLLAGGEPVAVALARAQEHVRCHDPAAMAAAAGFVCVGSGLPR